MDYVKEQIKNIQKRTGRCHGVYIEEYLDFVENLDEKEINYVLEKYTDAVTQRGHFDPLLEEILSRLWDGLWEQRVKQ